MNLFPEKVKKLMLPCKIEIEKPEVIEAYDTRILPSNICAGSNEENVSGSTCCEMKKKEEIKVNESSKIIFTKNLHFYYFDLFIY